MKPAVRPTRAEYVLGRGLFRLKALNIHHLPPDWHPLYTLRHQKLGKQTRLEAHVAQLLD